MDPIVSILKRVANGQQRFAPENESLEALRAFQEEVQVLHEAARQELVVGLQVSPPSKGRDTYGLSQLVLVNGGLSHKGKQYLTSPPKVASATRSWIVSHLAQIAVAVIGTLLATIIITKYGL